MPKKTTIGAVLVRSRAAAYPFTTMRPSTCASSQEALSRLLAGKTVLVIAHRMRTVENADKIVVLDEGCVVEEGAPADLMRLEGGMFRRMAELQQGSAAWSI